MEACARPWLCLEQVEIGMNSYLDDFKLHLLPLARPEWMKKELAVKMFDTGHTNVLMAIYLKEKGLVESREEVVLLRLNGTGSEKLVDRVDEIHFMLAMHEVGLGPPVYAQLQNGLCYGFAPGRQVGMVEVREKKVWKKIAEVMAALHTITIPKHFQNRKPQVWAKIDHWIQEVPRWFEAPQQQKRFVEGFGSIEALQTEVDWLRTLTASTHSPIVFCHNDVLIANLVFDEPTGEMHLVDHEYGGPNFLAFDIADHFCAFAGAGDMNYDLYPNEAFQKKWLHHYLSKRRQLMDSVLLTNEGGLHSSLEVEALYKEVSTFTLASHLFWTLWGLIQAHYSLIQFDYISYATVRFKEYLRRKASISSL